MHHIISLSMAIIFFLDMSKIFITGAISHFSPQHTICLNIFQPTFSASMVVYFYQYIYYKDAKNQILHSHHTSLLGAQSEPEPLLLELLLLLPDLLLAAGLPDFDLVPDLDLLLLDADPLRDLLLLLETDRDLDFERDFLPAATGLRVGDRDLLRLTLLLADLLLDLLRLTLRDLLRLTERDLLLLVQWPVLDDQLAVTDLLPSLQPPLAQPHPRLQLIVEHPILSEQEEEVLLVSLACLALNIPVIFPGHLVLVLCIISVVPALALVAPSLGHGLVRRQEIGNELFAGLVHHTPDHSLTHLFHLGIGCHPSRGWIRVKDHLGAWVLPHVGVRQDRHHLDRVDVWFAVVVSYRFQGIFKCFLNSSDLRVSVHVEVVNIHLLPHSKTNVRLHLLDGRWLVPGLFCGDVIGPSHPGQGDAVLARPLRVGHSVHLLLQQLLVVGVHGRLVKFVDRVSVGVDQVDSNTEVVLGQQLILVVPLQASGVVGDESLCVKWVGDELRVERNVRQVVAVLHPADKILPLFRVALPRGFVGPTRPSAGTLNRRCHLLGHPLSLVEVNQAIKA